VIRTILRATLLLAGLLAIAVVVDLGSAAWKYGPEYVRRVVVWRAPSPQDVTRYRVRALAASSHPVVFPVDPAGAQQVRAAFAHIAPLEALPGETMEAFLSRTGTTSLIVLRGGTLLYEGYFNGATRDDAFPSFSMAKSVLAMLIGDGIAAGRMPPIDTPAETVLREMPVLHGSGIRLRDLLDMTSGFAIDESWLPWLFRAPWGDSKLMNFAPDLRTAAVDARLRYPPGSEFQYDDRNAILLGMAFEDTTGEQVTSALARVLWQPMGAEFPASWAIDSRRGDMEKMESGINARPIDFLKLGQLVLRHGVAENGARVLPADWVAEMTAPTPHRPGWSDGEDMFYGLLWWGLTRRDGPADPFANGILGQVLLISPANDMVVLRMGRSNEGVASWPRLLRTLADAVGR
jgi:CubicO group peptidase (beta-lactamase class C family)